MKGRKPRKIIDRFLDKIEPIPESGCWIWMGGLTSAGYGAMRIGSQVDGSRRMETMHRLSFKLFNGKIPSGKIVCHKCHVRSCVNPDHLYAGTLTDNNRDTVKAGNWKNGHSIT